MQQYLMMRVILPSFIAVIAFASSNGQLSRSCHFPRQMSGDMAIVSVPFRSKHVFKPPYSAFEVDFDKNQAIIYPQDNDFGDNSISLQSLRENVMYTFPYRNGRPTGKCTYMRMPPELMFPSSLPANWSLIFSNDDERSYQPSPKGGRTNYFISADTVCDVVDIFHEYVRTDASNFLLDIEVFDYKFHYKASKRFDLNRTKCTFAGNFDSLY